MDYYFKKVNSVWFKFMELLESYCDRRIVIMDKVDYGNWIRGGLGLGQFGDDLLVVCDLSSSKYGQSIIEILQIAGFSTTIETIRRGYPIKYYIINGHLLFNGSRRVKGLECGVEGRSVRVVFKVSLTGTAHQSIVVYGKTCNLELAPISLAD